MATFVLVHGGGHGGWCYAKVKALLEGGVTDADDLACADERLTGHPWRCFEQPLVLTNEDALWALPQYHIVCESTLPTRDTRLIEPARATGRLWSIDTGHDLMITEPEFVAGALVEISEERT